MRIGELVWTWLVAIVCFVSGIAFGCKVMRCDAVVNGVATYEADKNGKPVFKWKKPE